jgi:hypothetical protein
MDGRAANDIYAVGAGGTVRHYDGIAWSPVTSGTVDELLDVWANPVGDVFIAGKNGTVLRCSGANCLPLHPPTSESLGGIWGSSDTSVWVVSWTGTLLRYDGLSWTSQDTGLEGLYGIWGSAPGNFIATGWGRFLRFDGIELSIESVSEHIAWRIHGSSASNVFTGGEHSFLAHHDGLGWAMQSNPLATAVPTRRIGEYNGVAAAGQRTFAVWCGNTFSGAEPLDQQAIFDAFDTAWQVGISIVDLTQGSSTVVLEPARPNPSGGPTSFAYSVPQAQRVNLSLVDVRGRRVATLIHGQQPPGRHVVPWDGRDDTGNAVASGVYFLRLETGQAARTQKVVLTR